MEKEDNQYKNYRALSKNESALLNAVKPFTVFSFSDSQRLTGWKRSRISNTLASLKSKGTITLAKKGNYLLTEAIPANIFRIANAITGPSYISFWTALSYYGFTEQHPAAIQVVSTKQYPLLRIGKHPIETTTFQPSRFYGYQKRENFTIAEPEKAIIDAVHMPEKAGGMDEIRKCLRNAWPSLDRKRLLGYTRRFGSKAVAARLGFLIEQLRLKEDITGSLKRLLPKSYVRLNPRGAITARYDPRWMVMEND